MSTDTKIILESYLHAVINGVDVVMQDFTEDSVIIKHHATYRGLAEIRQFYTTELNRLPKGFWNAFKVTRQEVMREMAYILWEAKPWFILGTDTLVIRNGKILFQTVAACKGSE